MTSEKLRTEIRNASEKFKIFCASVLAEHCGLNLDVVMQAWVGDRSITVIDLSIICNSLNLDLTFIAISE